MRTDPRMTYEHKQRVAAWVRANLKKQKMSIAELARRMVAAGCKGIIPSNISHSLGLRRRFSALEIEKMEEIFDNEFRSENGANARLAILNKSQPAVVLGGIIAIGYREHALGKSAQITEIPPVLLERYATVPQEAWLVEGDACDLYAPAEASVIVVNYWNFRPSPQIGDYVVVRRYHPILFGAGDLSQAEHTVRRIVDRDGSIVLKSLSTNPRVTDIVYNLDDKSVEIIKLVIGVLRYERY